MTLHQLYNNTCMHVVTNLTITFRDKKLNVDVVGEGGIWGGGGGRGEEEH